MIVKIVLYVLVGGLVGFIFGLIFRRLGGSCPITCTPWGSIISGAILGLLLALDK